MQCGECGYLTRDCEILDIEPAQYEGDKDHPNYLPDEDGVWICPQCAEEERRIDAYHAARYQSAYAYACGYRD